MGRKPKRDKPPRQPTKAALQQKAAKEKIKELRPFIKRLRAIDLRKSISPSQRAYINRAFSEYHELTTRPVKIFRSKNKLHLEKAQAYSRHVKGGPKFDVAFVPVPETDAKLIFKGNQLKIKTKYVTQSVIFFNLPKLAVDAQSEIERAMQENREADQFVIMAGKYLFNGGIVRSLVPKKVQELMARYANPEDNHFWGNWLFGLEAFEYQNQHDFDQYRREYHLQSAEIKKQKLSARRKWAQTYGVTYICKTCKQIFKSKDALNAHQKRTGHAH